MTPELSPSSRSFSKTIWMWLWVAPFLIGLVLRRQTEPLSVLSGLAQLGSLLGASFGLALLLHFATLLLASAPSWRTAFSWTVPGFLFLLSLENAASRPAVAWLFILAAVAGAIGLVGKVYNLRFGQVCGVWILATALGGGILVPYVFVKALWSTLEARHHNMKGPPATVATKGSKPELAAVMLHQQAIAAIKEKRFTDAEKALRQSLLLRNLLGRKDIELASTYYEIGELYAQQHLWARAENYYKQALLTAQDVLEDQDPDLANYLNALGSVFLSQQRFMEAEALHAKAVKITEPVKRRRSALYKEYLLNYAQDLRGLGRAADATQLESRASHLP